MYKEEDQEKSDLEKIVEKTDQIYNKLADSRFLCRNKHFNNNKNKKEFNKQKEINKNSKKRFTRILKFKNHKNDT